MKTLSTFLGVVFALALLLVILAGGYFLFKYLVDILGALDPQVKTIVAIASVVALLCTGVIAGGLRSFHDKASRSDTMGQKAGIYERLLSCYTKELKSQMEGDASPAERERVSLEQRLVLYGSPKVLKAYANLRRESTNGDREGSTALLQLNKLVLEMRKDLGQRDPDLKETDFIDLLTGSD